MLDSRARGSRTRTAHRAKSRASLDEPHRDHFASLARATLEAQTCDVESRRRRAWLPHFEIVRASAGARERCDLVTGRVEDLELDLRGLAELIRERDRASACGVRIDLERAGHERTGARRARDHGARGRQRAGATWITAVHLPRRSPRV